MCYPILLLRLLKHQAFLLQALLGRQFFFGRELMLRLPVTTLFILSILVFLRTERQSVA